MDKNKFTEKLKEGISVQEIEQFARKHLTEVFFVLALFVGAISSSFNFFTGPGLTIFLTMVGAILGIFFPVNVERILKKLYTFAIQQEKGTQIVIGSVKIVIGIFIPFVLFGLVGLLAGTSYHYYTRQALSSNEFKKPKGHRGVPGEEHD